MPADAPVSDRADSEPEVNWDYAKSRGSLRAALGYKDDPDDDGHNWYPVFGGYGG